MKKLFFAIVLASSATLFSCNGSLFKGGYSGGKGWEPSQKATFLLLCNKPKTDKKKENVKIGSPKIGPRTGFGFLND